MKPAEKLLTAAGYDKTYWGEQIIFAEKRGKFLESDCLEAWNWPTCACGKLDDRIPRGYVGVPLDKDLKWWGSFFFDSVSANDFVLAADLLIKIEIAAAKVLLSLDQETP